jgi:DedD protein
MGVFSDRDNAERLAKQLRGKGYSVVVNEASASGKRLYRVRVGPEAERAAADAVGAKLRAAGHRDARVVAFP